MRGIRLDRGDDTRADLYLNPLGSAMAMRLIIQASRACAHILNSLSQKSNYKCLHYCIVHADF